MKLVNIIAISAITTSLSLAAYASPDQQSSEHHPDAKPMTQENMPMQGMKGNMPMGQGGMPMMQNMKGHMPMGQGNMPMMQMMQNKQAMMQAHMKKMEAHMANIEALLKQLVELHKP